MKKMIQIGRRVVSVSGKWTGIWQPTGLHVASAGEEMMKKNGIEQVKDVKCQIGTLSI